MRRSAQRLRILVADDHELVRRGIRGLLLAKLHCRIVAEARDGSEAVTQAQESRPDIVILDIDMPNANGLQAAPRILAILPSVKIIFLTIHESAEMAARVRDTGAAGLVLKSEMAEQLIKAVRHVSRNGPFLAPKSLEFFGSDTLSASHSKRSRTALRRRPSVRQREIIRLVSKGKTNKEIAATLGISVRTVEMHRAKAMKKLGLHSLAEVVHYAIRAGLTAANSQERGNARFTGARVRRGLRAQPK